MKRVAVTSVIIGSVVLALAGCSSGSATEVTKTVVSTVTAGPTTSESPKATAHAAALKLRVAIPQVRKLVDMTEETDENKLLGRPNGYTAATVIYDSRAECDGSPGVDCGAVIEQWPDQVSADKRSKYIQRVRGEVPIVGQEYDSVRGGLLLRVSGTLTPSAAKAYAAAFNRGR